MRPLESSRLLLEPVTRANADVLWQIMQAPNLRDYQDVPRYTREAFRERVALRPEQFSGRSNGRFEWLIQPVGTTLPVGWISLRLGDHGSATAELGYSLIACGRGRGYATEAVRLLLDEAFETTPLRRVEAACVVDNLSSRRLLVRVGFRRMRLQRHGAVVRGRAVDILIFSLDADAWQRARMSTGHLEPALESQFG